MLFAVPIVLLGSFVEMHYLFALFVLFVVLFGEETHYQGTVKPSAFPQFLEKLGFKGGSISDILSNGVVDIVDGAFVHEQESIFGAEVEKSILVIIDLFDKFNVEKIGTLRLMCNNVKIFGVIQKGQKHGRQTSYPFVKEESIIFLMSGSDFLLHEFRKFEQE